MSFRFERRRTVGTLPLLISAASLVGACSAEGPGSSGEVEDTAEIGSAQKIPGFGYYCSSLWPDGTWALGYGDLESNPCAGLSGGGAVMREGVYSTTGQNTVV